MTSGTDIDKDFAMLREGCVGCVGCAGYIGVYGVWGSAVARMVRMVDLRWPIPDL